jgi:small subunit ribosomal protein S4e
LGKKGKTTRLKRKPAPRTWPIHRKEFVWVTKPSPGPHSLENCLPMAIVLRDILGVAKTGKEAKTILSQGKVYVDGKIRRTDDFPVGLMDVISVPELNKFFRILPSHKGLVVHPVSEEETSFKLCRIEDKTIIKNGHIQLNLHDGSNMLVKVVDPKNPREDVYETFDTLKISLPEKQIVAHIRIKENNFAIITGGKNAGRYGKIVEIEKAEGKKRRNSLIVIKDEEGNQYQTTLNFVFAIGETEPLISLLEEAPLD